MTPWAVVPRVFFHSAKSMELSTTIRLGENVIRINENFDNVLGNFQECAKEWDPSLIISDATGRRLVLSSSRILEILSDAVQKELAMNSKIQETPVGEDRRGFKTKSGGYGILLEERSNCVIYRILQEWNGIFRRGFKLRAPKNVIEEWTMFTSLGDGDYVFAPPPCLPDSPPVEEEKYPMEVGSVVAVWGKHNKLWFYKLVNLNPLTGSFLHSMGGQTFEEGKTPHTEELDYETFLYFGVPHRIVDGKYRIAKITRRKCMHLMRESIRKTAE
jgi:hypothetical protein